MEIYLYALSATQVAAEQGFFFLGAGNVLSFAMQDFVDDISGIPCS